MGDFYCIDFVTSNLASENPRIANSLRPCLLLLLHVRELRSHSIPRVFSIGPFPSASLRPWDLHLHHLQRTNHVCCFLSRGLATLVPL